jgi:hypothetical protein
VRRRAAGRNDRRDWSIATATGTLITGVVSYTNKDRLSAMRT